MLPYLLCGAFLSALSFVFGSLLRRCPPAVRRAHGVATLFALLVLPLLGLLPSHSVAPTAMRATNRPVSALTVMASHTSLLATQQPAPRATAPPQFTSAPLSTAAAAPVLSVLYLFGVGLFLVRLGRSLWRAHRLVTACVEANVPEVAAVNAVLCPRNPARVFLCTLPSELTMPVTLGNRVLLPHDALEWPHERRDAVLRHELAHLHRRDWIILLLGEAIQVVHWCNPFCWLVVRQLRRDMEAAADAIAIESGLGRTEYARHLVDVAALLRQTSCPALVLPLTETGELGQRIEAILKPAPRGFVSARIAVVGSVLCLLATIPLSLALRPERTKVVTPKAMVTEKATATPSTTAITPEQFAALEKQVRRWSGRNTLSTVIEFSDIECPACRRAWTSGWRNSGIKHGFVHMPLSNIHPRAYLAAIATEIAGRQGFFWPVLNKVMQGDISEAGLTATVKRGIPPYDYLRSNIDEMDTQARSGVEHDLLLANQFDIHECPTFVISHPDGQVEKVVGIEALQSALRKTFEVIITDSFVVKQQSIEFSAIKPGSSIYVDDHKSRRDASIRTLVVINKRRYLIPGDVQTFHRQFTVNFVVPSDGNKHRIEVEIERPLGRAFVYSKEHPSGARIVPRFGIPNEPVTVRLYDNGKLVQTQGPV